MSSKLLIHEPALQVLPTLACRIGLVEAIVLQQLHYLCLTYGDESGAFQRSHKQLVNQFVFLSERTLRRALVKLRDLGLVAVEIVGVGVGRVSVYRIDYEALTALDVKGSGQSGRGQIGRTPAAKLAGPRGQIGRTPLIKEEEEKTEDESPSGDSSTARAADVISVFRAWVEITGRKAADTKLDAQRVEIIEVALHTHGLADCLDAVRGWRHSPFHCGENVKGIVYNSLGVLLRNASQIEQFRDLERKHGVGSNGASTCPGADVSIELVEEWERIAEDLRRRVPAPAADIWLSTLHPHGEHDGDLVVGVAPGVASWVGDRFIDHIVAAAGRPVAIVACDLEAAA